MRITSLMAVLAAVLLIILIIGLTLWAQANVLPYGSSIGYVPWPQYSQGLAGQKTQSICIPMANSGTAEDPATYMVKAATTAL